MFLIFKYLFYLAGGGVTLTAGLASYLAFLQPAFYFPKPTGKNAVGTTTYHWTDETRKKELMVQLWYPTDGNSTDKPTTPYAPYYIDYLKKNQKIPWLLSMARPMYTHAMNNAPVVQNKEQLPVIVFSHGWGATRNTSTAYCEELASHGYTVVGISHSSGCSVTQFPDGRIISPPFDTDLLENPLDSLKVFDEEIEFWIDDVRMVLDNLEHIGNDTKSQFCHRLDMDNIGIFGHSYGGAAAVQLCRRDPRIKAGVNMDGALLGTQAITEINKPFMFLCAKPIAQEEMLKLMKNFGIKEEYVERYCDAVYQSYIPAINTVVQKAKRDMYKLTIKDAAHMTFSDIALIKEGALLARPLQNFGAGKINGYRATEIVTQHQVSFFDKYLKGIPSTIFDGDEEMVYPEVIYEKK